MSRVGRRRRRAASRLLTGFARSRVASGRRTIDRDIVRRVARTVVRRVAMTGVELDRARVGADAASVRLPRKAELLTAALVGLRDAASAAIAVEAPPAAHDRRARIARRHLRARGRPLRNSISAKPAVFAAAERRREDQQREQRPYSDSFHGRQNVARVAAPCTARRNRSSRCAERLSAALAAHDERESDRGDGGERTGRRCSRRRRAPGATAALRRLGRHGAHLRVCIPGRRARRWRWRRGRRRDRCALALARRARRTRRAHALDRVAYLCARLLASIAGLDRAQAIGSAPHRRQRATRRRAIGAARERDLLIDFARERGDLRASVCARGRRDRGEDDQNRCEGTPHRAKLITSAAARASAARVLTRRGARRVAVSPARSTPNIENFSAASLVRVSL